MVPRAGHTCLITLFIVIALRSDIIAQATNVDYNFKHLNVQNGLTQNIVYHFLQDSRGYMWIGTHNGLSLFDGIKTINFLYNDQEPKSVSGNFITAILEDSAHQIWLGNENGINSYNRADHSFSHYAVDRPGGKKDTTYCVPLGFITATDLWFLDTKTKSIRSLNTKTKSTSFLADLNANNAVFYSIPASNTVHIWSTYGKGTTHMVFSDSRLIRQQTFFTGNNSQKEPVLDISHVFQQNDTTAWLSTNEGLVRLNPELNQYKIFNAWDKGIVRELRYAALSPKGHLWLGSGPDGIYSFDTKTNQFVNNFRYDKSDPFSICSNNIVSLYFDRMGNIWCGSFGNGTSYTNIENIFFNKHISKSELRSSENDNTISWIEYDRNGNLWCMFANIPGLWIVDRKFQIIERRFPVLENGAKFFGYTNKLVFETGDENIWYATNKGLFIYNIHRNRLYPVKYQPFSEELMGSYWINDIIRLNDGSIIFSTFAGLYRITHENNQYIVKPFTTINREEFNGFRRIFEDADGTVYVKSMGEQLFVLQPNHSNGNYAVKKLDFSPLVNHFFYDKGEKLTYMATSDGLYFINNKNFKIEKKRFGNNVSFPANINIVLKSNNQFWLFGEKGIYFFDEKSNSHRVFTTEDGLAANEFSPSALIYQPGGRCIAGSSNGLVSFLPAREQYSFYPPGVQIRNIYINDKADSSVANPDDLKKIDLSYKQNTFAFDFAPISFYRPADCGFEYTLEGYDEAWIKSGPAQYTRYSKIPPGNYVLKLRAMDAMGKVGTDTKILEIQVGRAFWQTTFFRIAVLALLVLIGWLLSRLYFSQKIRKQKLEFEKQQAIERERTRIATDMHDDLGAGLSRIKFISQTISNKKTNGDIIKTELEKITVYSDEMTEKMGEIVWALNEKNDTLADLVAYSRSYAIEYLANHNISCKADTPLGLPETFIAGETRRNIFLSVKECLHNIVKHSGASCVRFSVELGRSMKITIHDNGRGIDWSTTRAFSNGIQNTRRRMKDVKGEAKFGNDQGTKVELIIPL